MSLGFLFQLAAGVAANVVGNVVGGGLEESSRSDESEIMAGGLAAGAGSTVVLEEHIRRLEGDLAKSLMISEALWELLRDKTELTDDDLCKKISDVDMRDGRLDGKNQRKSIACPKCGRMVSFRHHTCMYCGQATDASTFSL